MNDNFIMVVKCVLKAQGIKPLIPTSINSQKAQVLIDEVIKFIPEKEQKECEIFYPYIQRLVYFMYSKPEIIKCITKHLIEYSKEKGV